MEHISVKLSAMLAELRQKRDNEVMTAHGCGMQYIADHNDREAWRNLDREVNRLARAWDAMILLLERAEAKAVKIEASCANFYGD